MDQVNLKDVKIETLNEHYCYQIYWMVVMQLNMHDLEVDCLMIYQTHIFYDLELFAFS